MNESGVSDLRRRKGETGEAGSLCEMVVLDKGESRSAAKDGSDLVVELILVELMVGPGAGRSSSWL